MQNISSMLNGLKRDGYVICPTLLDEEQLSELHDSVLTIGQTNHPGHVLESHGQSYRAFHGCHLYDSAFDRLVRLPMLLDFAKSVLGEDVYIHQLKVNMKQAFSGEAWPWHQDYIYWQREDAIPTSNILSVMIFLDDIVEFNGPLYFIPRSHKEGCINVSKTNSLSKGWEDNVSASLTYQVSSDIVERLVSEGGLVSATGKRGTVVWFDANIVHASPPNMSPFQRRMIIVTYNALSNAPLAQSNQMQRPDFLNGRNRSALQTISE